MIDGTTRLLLERYRPDDTRLLQDITAKSTEKKLRIVMNASVLPIEVCEKACHLFNKDNRADMARNFILITDYQGIAAGSWVTYD